MSFIENIKENLGEELCPPTYRALIFGDNAVYFEGVKSITSYDDKEIVLALKRGSLRLYGKNMRIKKYCAGDVVVCGVILKLERV